VKVAVITSTRGRKTIQKAHLSILNQTYPATHYVFAHGKDCWDAVDKNMNGCNAQIVYLPRANGGGGFGMAPVFAMAGYCVTEDVVFYLDDDNWYEDNHIESLVEIIDKNNLGWAYSLRRIVDHEGNFICDDNCESLGAHSNSHHQHLVDNSCYAVRTDVARRYGYAWYVPVISDRNFFKVLVEAGMTFGATGKHSVNYSLSLDGTGGMTKEKFLANNELNQQNYKGTSPWLLHSIFKQNHG
jgi:glycosyltransferase involved in cell wall biosynthesis